MPNCAVITFAALVFERDHFLVFALLDHFGGNFRPTDGKFAAVDVRDRFKGGGFAGFDSKQIDINRVAFRDAILPTAGFNNCVSHKVVAAAVPGGRTLREKEPRNVSQNYASDKQN